MAFEFLIVLESCILIIAKHCNIASKYVNSCKSATDQRAAFRHHSRGIRRNTTGTGSPESEVRFLHPNSRTPPG